jgi:hypothetical protein
MAALVSVLTSIASGPGGGDWGTASLVKNVEYH